MIEHILVLKQSLAGKDIYLWDIGKLAMWTFFRAAARGIDIKGFITNFSEYQGETIMNRPVLSPEALQDKTDYLILTADGVSDGTFALVSSYGPCCRWSDALEYNPLLRGTPVFFWGIGSNAWNFIRNTAYDSVRIRAFLSEKTKTAYQLLGWMFSPQTM